MNHLTSTSTRLTTMDREAIQWMRDFASASTLAEFRDMYMRNNPVPDPAIMRGDTSALFAGLLGRASVYGGEVAGIIARLTGEDV